MISNASAMLCCIASNRGFQTKGTFLFPHYLGNKLVY